MIKIVYSKQHGTTLSGNQKSCYPSSHLIERLRIDQGGFVNSNFSSGRLRTQDLGNSVHGTSSHGSGSPEYNSRNTVGFGIIRLAVGRVCWWQAEPPPGRATIRSCVE